jgi:hypothetical protein
MIGMFDVDRTSLFEAIHTSEKYNLSVPSVVEGDSISILAASGTFHADLGGQAIFDVEKLEYTGNAGRIEVFSAPNDGSNLYTTGNRIYFELSPSGSSPWSAYGLVDGRYVNESSWRLGVRVTVGGVPSTKSGVFTGIVPGTIAPLP